MLNCQNNASLGLDLGEKTLGIALSQTGIIAQNLKTIIFATHKYDRLIAPLQEIISRYQIKTIVLGYPKHMNNDIGIKAKISSDFKKTLENKFEQVKVILWDERLSTVQAIQMLKTNNKKKGKILQMKDEIAATIILQNYLDYIKLHPNKEH
ncbi:putative pre-16S rRNA nuclease [Hydrangea phyllody phytoplasma]|uniref:Putative pre-16S rRNA nuclease n=3 Tax=16SrI (Aster yellows group) TaxID=3042590 RepID=A0ABQ5PU25_9MOLU|nr:MULTISPECIES: Holliday junction resolvase RuvX [16SrI (Aster yellows group)]MBS2993965.1 Holliday junction resolvase RuvX ['Santalum album' aster yellows phytoplasma]GFZ75221.1 putative pre-16S rRNA nuclease [Hydrangea phyllody phytoplasma]GLH61517.1 putative pre-16S rRNA nuclease [Rhus yellows phytoplasma]GLH61835.1 putative pre-16S rRNA nuclease [Hydrangea phyllody phytoplasma]